MKKFLIGTLAFLALAGVSCRGNETVDEAYDVYESGDDYSRAAAVLAADTLDYSQLSMKDFAKLGLALTYISAYTIDESDKIDMDRFEEISREYEKAKSRLTPEQRKKLNEERARLVK